MSSSSASVVKRKRVPRTTPVPAAPPVPAEVVVCSRVDVFGSQKHDEHQAVFVDHPLVPHQHIIVNASAGSGKTECMTDKICYEFLRRTIVDSSFFLLISFTNVAANEAIARGMKAVQKYPQMCGYELFNTANVRTIDKVGMTILRQAHGVEVANGYAKAAMLSSNGYSSRETICAATMKLLSSSTMEEASKYTQAYKNVRVIFVDECRDTTSDRWCLIQWLATQYNACIVAVGDINQQIFPNTDNTFLDTFDTKIPFLYNYRSQEPIIRLCNMLMPNLSFGLMKGGSTSSSCSTLPCLFESNMYSKAFTYALRYVMDTFECLEKLPHPRTVGVLCFTNEEVNEIKTLLIESGEISFTIISSKSKRGEDDGEEQSEHCGKCGSGYDKRLDTLKLYVMTIHQSKGKEFDAAMVCKPTKYPRGFGPDTYARLLFVAATRARSVLTFVYPTSNHYYRNKTPQLYPPLEDACRRIACKRSIW
jgi:superfamily I DNA/RNA helicase